METPPHAKTWSCDNETNLRAMKTSWCCRQRFFFVSDAVGDRIVGGVGRDRPPARTQWGRPSLHLCKTWHGLWGGARGFRAAHPKLPALSRMRYASCIIFVLGLWRELYLRNQRWSPVFLMPTTMLTTMMTRHPGRSCSTRRVSRQSKH